MKWRFVERGPLSIALKPKLTAPTGNDRRAGTGRVGTGATLLAQLDVARFSFLANAGMTYQPNRQGDLTSIWAVSGAAIYKATDKLQIVADIGTSRHGKQRRRESPS